MRFPPPLFSSSLAAVLIMATAGVQAGSVQVRSASSTFFGGTIITSGGTPLLTNNSAAAPLYNLTFSGGPATTGNHVTVSPVMPLRFPGAPLTGLAGLPFVMNTVMSLLSQTGVTPISPPASGTTVGSTINLSRNLYSGSSAVVVTNNPGTGLTKAGSGTLSLTPGTPASASTAGPGAVTPGTLTLGPVSTGVTLDIAAGTVTAGPPSILYTTNTNPAGTLVVTGPISTTGAGGISVSGAGILTLTSANNTFAGPVVLKAGSLIVTVPLSVNEADPGTAFSESNPVSLIESEGGALFPVGTTVKVIGLMGAAANSPVATIENQSAGTMIIKRTSSGGLSFKTAMAGVAGPP